MANLTCWLPYRSSSIIWRAMLCSSSMLLLSIDDDIVAPAAAVVGDEQEFKSSPLLTEAAAAAAIFRDLFFLWSSTVITHFEESEDCPARFCHTPIWEFSVSSLRQVSEGDGVLLHFLSFAWSISDNSFGESWPSVDFVSGSELFSVTGKLVFAFRPLINMAAWSYALAASSAVSNVPSHTLLFLLTF